MRTIILIMLATLALGAAASAAYPVQVTVASDHAWMVADNKDTATIRATVISGTGVNAGQPLAGANVAFTVNPPWQLKDSFLVTDANGNATTTLSATKASGTANITVTAFAMILTDTWGYLNYSASTNLSQPIDHDTPKSITSFYNGQVQVRSSTHIAVLVRDKFGNPVDNRNVVENVRFDASAVGASGFLSGTSWVKSITVPVNGSGYVDVQYLVDPVGTNYVSITPPSPLNQQLISIEGISQGTPFSVSSIVSPGGTPYPYTTIKTGIFTIGYTFRDQFGYLTANQQVNITTSIPGESMSLTTNKNGMVVITYGPKDIAGIYNITARAATNLSASATANVEFVSGAPADALFTASPQTMASRDVMDNITSTLIMKVVDQKGNPVSGELVNFRFTSLPGTGFNQTMLPVLENGVTSTSATNVDIPATSDDNGDATVTFHPGAFSTDFTAPGYNTSATGSAIVQAQWSTVKRQVTLKYLNSRYLTIQSWVSPSTVQVNQTVDVTVLVKGDGWALQPKPIDVILVTDRSGSMLDDYPDREVSVMAAGNVFSRQLDFTRDRLGLVSFGSSGQQWANSSQNSGWDNTTNDDVSYALANYQGNGRTYSDNATLDLGLSNVPASISTQINSTVPGGWTPMRYAIYTALNATKNKWNPNSVRAVIVLSDGDYNHYGDPLARVASKSTMSTNPGDYGDLTSKWYSFSGLNASFQNMTTYANAYNVKIFTIGFAQSISSGGKKNLTALANLTGGKYYDATAANLASVYTDIAGSLKDTAGVNTTMSLSFQNINVTVDNVTSVMAGNQVYNYTYISGHSTLIDTGNSTIAHFAGYPVTFDNSSQWKSSQGFTFNIGTIRLGQFWQSTVTLQVLKGGTINVFDPNSNVTTQDTTNTQKLMPLTIPGAYIVALPNNSAPTLQGAAQLDIDDLNLTNAGSQISADLHWNLSYNGLDPISEDIMVAAYSTNQWNHIPLQQVSNVTTFDTASIPIDDLAAGYYTIRVDVNANDSNSDTATLEIYIDGSGVRGLFPGEIPTPPGVPPVPTTPTISYIKIS
ncbi:MAG: hypothetical protein ABSD81_07285 [Methanomicrobiales archaeon]